MSETIPHDDVPPGQREPGLYRYFRAMVRENASDLHLKVGSPPHLRLRTRILPVKGGPLSAADIDAMVDEVLDPRQQQVLRDEGSVDAALELEGSDRFRVNVYRQRGTLSVAVRRVSRTIPSFAELHLPPEVGAVAENHDGLVLVSGITGSGKSTTIAAMIERINQTRACHVVTIEDPIEYLYTDRKALVDQREVGLDARDFATALRSLMREDPDVVLVGEMRDYETMSAALQAAETGHLVFATVHASSAASTLTRVLDLFAADSRDLVRQSLAFNLRAVICQRLLPSVAKGVDRVPAVELLLANPAVRDAIRDGRDADLTDIIRASRGEGMRDFVDSLQQLVEQDLVDPKMAYEVAPSPEELRMRLKGISASRPGILGR